MRSETAVSVDFERHQLAFNIIGLLGLAVLKLRIYMQNMHL